MRTVATLAFILLIPTTAFAQLPTAGEAMKKTETATDTKAVTEYDFDVDDVKGAMIKPLDENVHGSTHRRTSSLINVRANFVPELITSVEEI